MVDVSVFQNHLLEAGIVDPERIHHEFVKGDHGQKIDFEKILPGSELESEWHDAMAGAVDLHYPVTEVGKIVILSVADGTNRHVEPVAERLGSRAIPLQTVKIADGVVALTAEARKAIQAISPDLVVAMEDTATTGSTSATAVMSARNAGAKRVEVLNTWQRRQHLERLLAIGATYHSIIYRLMPSFKPEECLAIGFCSQGWELIRRSK